MNADQQALVGLAAEVFAGRTANEQLAKTEVSETRVDEELWRELAGAGLLGIAVPEELGEPASGSSRSASSSSSRGASWRRSRCGTTSSLPS